MPSKKKKYNARFPPARIKKIMQMDDEVGKVAAPVPVIISRALELFIEALIDKSRELMQSRNTRTLTAGHMKHVIVSEEKYSFLAELVRNIADVPVSDPDDAVKPSVHRQQQSNTPNETVRAAGSATGERRPRGRPKKQATGDVQTGSEVKAPGKRRRQKIPDSEKPPKRRRKKKELAAVDVDVDADLKVSQEDSLQEAGVAVSHDSSGENSSSTLDCNEDSISVDDKEGDDGVSDAVTTVAVPNGLHQSNKLTLEQIESDCMPASSLKPGSVTVGNAEHDSIVQKFPTELPRHLNETLHGSLLTAANFQQSLQPQLSALNIATPSVDKSQAYLATHRMPPVLPNPRPLTSPAMLPLTVYAHCDARNNNSLSSPGLGQSNSSK